MRLAAILLMLFACALHAQAPLPLPSGVSGDYIGAGYSCRLTIDALPPHISADHWQVRMRCFEPDGDTSEGLTQTYGCPDTHTAIFLANGRSLIDSQWLYIRSINVGAIPFDTQIKVRVAPFAQAALVTPPADGGTHFMLNRIAYIHPVGTLCGIWPPTSTAKDE